MATVFDVVADVGKYSEFCPFVLASHRLDGRQYIPFNEAVSGLSRSSSVGGEQPIQREAERAALDTFDARLEIGLAVQGRAHISRPPQQTKGSHFEPFKGFGPF